MVQKSTTRPRKPRAGRVLRSNAEIAEWLFSLDQVRNLA
jgi:hypothetical protein